MCAEFPEPYERTDAPAEDDGDPAHEQRVSRHAAAASPGVPARSSQRRVRDSDAVRFML